MVESTGGQRMRMENRRGIREDAPARWKYVVGSFVVKPHQFGDAWDAVCRWLADSGYQPSDGYPYEYYPKEHEQGPPPVFTVDICVPVKPL